MKITNFEFKVKVKDLAIPEQRLLTLNPVFMGVDLQVDTYYNVSKGRLKLREGKIENALIYYNRKDTADAKESAILLYRHHPEQSLKDILSTLLGVKVVVNKKRKIYFIENVKFHFDTVHDLGTFMEVEAIDEAGYIGVQKLKEQCDEYFSFFGLRASDYINCSYSDLLIGKTGISNQSLY